jgi:hypothetical protein
MSVAFLERSIQLINGKIHHLKHSVNATILSAINQMSSAISIAVASISAIDERVSTLEKGGMPESAIPVATTTTSILISEVHLIDEPTIWTDGDDGTIVRVLGNNVTFNTLLLPVGATAGKYYVLTNTASTSNHHIDIKEGLTTKYTLQPLETATLVKTGDDWVGLMGIVPKVATTLANA